MYDLHIVNVSLKNVNLILYDDQSINFLLTRKRKHLYKF